MQLKRSSYATIGDDEWIEILTSSPRDERACDYFFNIKCRVFLKYIASTLFCSDGPSTLAGEFYEYLSSDDWRVLRLFTARNGASLGSYLSRCALNHFKAKKIREEKRRTVWIEHPYISEELERFTQEEEHCTPPVWQAYSRLCKRDRDILRLLVIENKSAIEAADEIWPQVKSSTKDWQQLPVKRVQDTIAMLKRRALLALTVELQKAQKGYL